MYSRLIPALLISTLLTACATVPNTSIEALGGVLPEGNGVVVAETITNGERITGRVRYWDEIVLWRLDYEGEDKTFSVDSLKYSLSTQAYMGFVPAGKYRVGMLYAFLNLGDVSYSARALAPPAMGIFEVKPGQVTNLGTILYQPFQDKNWIEASYPDYAMTRIDNDQLWLTAGQAYPDIAAQIDSAAPILGWSPDDFDEIRATAAQLVKGAALPTRLHALSGGRVTSSGLLGGLFLSSDGDWRNISLGSHYKVTDVVELPDGRFLTGHELGKLGVSAPIGENVRFISIGDGMEHVLDIDLSGSGHAIVLTLANTGYNIYKFDASTNSVSLLKALPAKKIGFLERAYLNYLDDLRHPLLVTTEEGVALYFEKKMYRFNEAAGQWVESEAAEFNALYQQRDGLISGTPYSSWSGTLPLQYSTDNGKSWTTSEEKGGFFGASREPTYRFIDGELVRPGDDVDVNFWTKSVALDEVPILSSTDNGLNWAPVSSVPRGCITLAVEASSDELLQILCANGGILSSSDRGRNWQQSMQPVLPDFDAFPAGMKVQYERP